MACGTALGHTQSIGEPDQHRCDRTCEQVENLVGLPLDPQWKGCVLHNGLQHREAHLLRNTLWVFLEHPLGRVEDVLLQGMCYIVGLAQLTALEREQAALLHRHGGMGLRRFNEDVLVATAARLSYAARTCAALATVQLAAGRGIPAPFRGAAELDVRAAVESLHRSWMSVKGVADSPDDPGEWARRTQAAKTLRMAGLRHAATHTDADARAAAVFTTFEVNAAGQAAQLRAAALSAMPKCGALASAWRAAQPGLAELSPVPQGLAELSRVSRMLTPARTHCSASSKIYSLARFEIWRACAAALPLHHPR